MEAIRETYYAAIKDLPNRFLFTARDNVCPRSFKQIQDWMEIMSEKLSKERKRGEHGWTEIGRLTRCMLRDQTTLDGTRPLGAFDGRITCGHIYGFLKTAGIIEKNVSIYPLETRIMEGCFTEEGYRTYYYNTTSSSEFEEFHRLLGKRLWSK